MGGAASVPGKTANAHEVQVPENYDAQHMQAVIQGAMKHMKEMSEQIAFADSSMRMISNMLGTIQIRSELGDFKLKFDEWKSAASEEEAALRLRQIKSLFVQPKVLFCSDMSGFSRICKEEGILHFLSLMKKMQSIMIPLLEARGGELVKVAADNLFVVFDDASQALRGAWDCITAAKKYSEGKGPNDSIKMSVGLAKGAMWLVDGCDVFGEAAHVAFKLGEDIASKEILISKDVRDALEDTSAYSFDMRREDIAGHMTTFYKVELKKEWPLPPMPRKIRPVINPPINAEEPIDFLTLLAQRQASDTKKGKNAVDALIHKRFTQKRAVLIIEMHEQAHIAQEFGVLEYISLMLRMKSTCESVAKGWRGKCVKAVESKVIGQVFALFAAPIDAIACALQCLHECRNEPYKLACGIGYTNILNLDACNCFGDAVNMAFKLAEDVAEENEILVTRNVIDAIRASEDEKFLTINPNKFGGESKESSIEVPLDDFRQVTLSSVTIDHWNLKISEEDAQKMTHHSDFFEVSARYANARRKALNLSRAMQIFEKARSVIRVSSSRGDWLSSAGRGDLIAFGSGDTEKSSSTDSAPDREESTANDKSGEVEAKAAETPGEAKVTETPAPGEAKAAETTATSDVAAESAADKGGENVAPDTMDTAAPADTPVKSAGEVQPAAKVEAASKTA